MKQPYDRSGRWLIQHHGDSILRLAGETRFSGWSAVQPELVQPRKLPDVLLEVHFPGEDRPVPYLIEIDTRPDPRTDPKMSKNAMLVYLDRGQWPEAITVVLVPRGEVPSGGRQLLFSRSGRARIECSWDVVKLWQVPAQELLDANDVGLVPWLPLTRFDGPPEPLVEECRRRIEHAPANEQTYLRAVTQILGGMRYNDPNLWNILGGRGAMIESPVLMELIAENTQDAIINVLEERFGPLPPALTLKLRAVKELERLQGLTRFTGVCPTLTDFELRLE